MIYSMAVYSHDALRSISYFLHSARALFYDAWSFQTSKCETDSPQDLMLAMVQMWGGELLASVSHG